MWIILKGNIYVGFIKVFKLNNSFFIILLSKKLKLDM